MTRPDWSVLLLRILLAPIALLYGLGVSLRSWLYRVGLLKGFSFDLPVISVGNLTVGGTGKTPHIEYLVRFLNDYLEIATLSRGYARQTKGFRLVQQGDTAATVGDEPLQFKRKFPEIVVAVGESRADAIPQILMAHPDTQVILLDDAYQHRSVVPSTNILLTEYRLPFTEDYLLPVGRLREWRAAYKRADLMIVTKCPPVLPDEERERLYEAIAPQPHQELFFSYYEYSVPHFIYRPDVGLPLSEDLNVMVVCAIANSEYLVDYVESNAGYVRTLAYSDHHPFSAYDMGRITDMFLKWEVDNKILLTTEKDAMRLDVHRDYILEKRLPIYVLPVEVRFHGNGEKGFREAIKADLLGFKA